MSDPLTIALVGAVAPTLTALAALIVGIRNSRSIEKVRHATNSLADRLIEATRKGAFAEGVKQEQQRHREEEGDGA